MEELFHLDDKFDDLQNLFFTGLEVTVGYILGWLVLFIPLEYLYYRYRIKDWDIRLEEDEENPKSKIFLIVVDNRIISLLEALCSIVLIPFGIYVMLHTSEIRLLGSFLADNECSDALTLSKFTKMKTFGTQSRKFTLLIVPIILTVWYFCWTLLRVRFTLSPLNSIKETTSSMLRATLPPG